MPPASERASAAAEPPASATTSDGERIPRKATELAQRLRVERHQLVIAVLAERVGDLVGA